MASYTQELFVESDDHLLRIIEELIRIGARFLVKPYPNGWLLRANLLVSAYTPQPLADIAGSTRVAPR